MRHQKTINLPIPNLGVNISHVVGVGASTLTKYLRRGSHLREYQLQGSPVYLPAKFQLTIDWICQSG